MTRNIAVLALLCALTFGIYGGTLGYPFVFDDYHVILSNTNIRSVSDIPALYFNPAMYPEEEVKGVSYRPFLFTTYALNYMVSGLEPGSYRVFNILIHILCSFLVYMTAVSLLERSNRGGGVEPASGPECGAAWPYALPAAMLFAAHPIQTEAVVYITARSASLAAAGCLASLWLFIGYHENRRPAWLAGAAVAYAAALLSKESAVPFLLVFPLVARALDRANPPGGRLPLRAYFPLTAAALAFTAYRGYLAVLETASHPFSRGILEQWTGALAALGRYAGLAVFPFGLSVEHDFRALTSASGIQILSGAAIVLAAIAAFAYYFRKSPAVSALVAWPLLAMSTEMLVPVEDFVVEYRMYLPLAGLLILAAFSARRFKAVPVRGWKMLAAVSAVISVTLVMSALSYSQVQLWRSPAALWANAVGLYPESVRARNNLGMALGRAGDYPGALEQLRAAVRLDPTHIESIVNLGNVYANSGELQKSIEVYRSALTIDPADYSASYNLALSYMDIGDFDAAYDVYANMVKAHPERKALPYTVAELLVSHGRQGLALRFINQYSHETR